MIGTSSLHFCLPIRSSQIHLARNDVLSAMQVVSVVQFLKVCDLLTVRMSVLRAAMVLVLLITTELTADYVC